MQLYNLPMSQKLNTLRKIGHRLVCCCPFEPRPQTLYKVVLVLGTLELVESLGLDTVFYSVGVEDVDESEEVDGVWGEVPLEEVRDHLGLVVEEGWKGLSRQDVHGILEMGVLLLD